MEPLVARSAVEHYVWPADVAEAYRLVVQHGGSARLVSGGTDLVLHPPAGMTTLVDLSRLPLAYVEWRDGAVVVGATTTLTEMLRHPILGEFAGGVLSIALAQLGSPALRNAATIGGHVTRGRLSDLVPVLLVLDAEVRCFDGVDQSVPLVDFYESQWRDRPLVMTELLLPAGSRNLATGFVRFSRTAFDFAVLNCSVALGLGGGRVTLARVAVGETPALAQRVAEVEAHLVGRALDEETIEHAARLASQVVVTGNDQRASAKYRSHLVQIGIRQCLRTAAGRPEVEP